MPVTPSQWSRDPFGGDLVDGEVWGRGAIDMLNLTSSMAVAVRHLAESGFRPKGTLVYCAVADEEAGGTHGAGWLADHAFDDLGCDYVITESGGIVRDGPKGRTVDDHRRREGRLVAAAADHRARPVTGRCRSGSTTRS